MYTEKEKEAATKIIRRIAYEHRVPEEQVRADMKEAVNAGRSNPDPAVQARWASFHFSGNEPTAEEFVLWAVDLMKGMTN